MKQSPSPDTPQQNAQTTPEEAWSRLNDFLKSKVSLGNNRLPDHQAFIAEFGSWEQPDIQASDSVSATDTKEAPKT